MDPVARKALQRRRHDLAAAGIEVLLRHAWHDRTIENEHPLDNGSADREYSGRASVITILRGATRER
jgi:hypothetical protein